MILRHPRNAVPAKWWMPHRSGCLPSGRWAPGNYTFGNLAHKMPIGHLLSNAEGTVGSNSPHHRHRRCGFAGVWLSNLENIQLGYRSPRKPPSRFLHRFQGKEKLMSLRQGQLWCVCGVGAASSADLRQVTNEVTGVCGARWDFPV